MAIEPTSQQLQQVVRYTEDLLRTDAWLGKATDLLRAAAALEGDIEEFWRSVEQRRTRHGRFGDVHAPYFMLVAFAVENLCKAALIHRARDRLNNRPIRKLPKFLGTHDLRQLIARLNIRVSVEVEDLLVRLTQCSVWSARYPVPVFPNALRSSHEFSDGRHRFTAYFVKDDVRALKELVAILRTRVSEILREDA